jgi:hypothetical protein
MFWNVTRREETNAVRVRKLTLKGKEEEEYQKKMIRYD